MSFLYPIIPLIVVVGLLLFKKVSFKQIINGLFWGIIPFLLLTISSAIILPIFSSALNIVGMSKGTIYALIISFFTAALPEELFKFISIKFSSKKDKNSILINAILIGVAFASIESFMYASTMGVNLSLARTFQTWHLFYQLMMSFFLVKALNNNGTKNIIFNILALFLPIVCHTIHNGLAGSSELVSYIFIAVCIVTYVLTICLILKLRIEPKEEKDKWFGLKIAVIILSSLFVILIHSQNNNATLNENQYIKEDNIELKVISSETIESDDFLYAGSYLKVKVEIKNNNDTTYKINVNDFSIVDNLNKNNSYLSMYPFDDSIYEIAAGETAVGYLYFDDEGHDYTYLIFTVGELGDTENYTFGL